MPDDSTHNGLKSGYAIPVAQRSDDNNKLLELIDYFEEKHTTAKIEGEFIDSTSPCAESYSDSDDDGTMYEPC